MHSYADFARRAWSSSRPSSAALLVLACVFLLRADARAQSAAQLLSGRIRDAVIALPGQGTAPVLIRVATVKKDFERRGFFRIGVLPIVVLEGVTLELGQGTPPDLQRVQRFLTEDAAKRVELTRVKVVVGGATTNTLECGRVQLSAKGQWELKEGVRFAAGSTVLTAGKASIEIAGERAGQVMMPGDPPRTFNLFGSGSIQTIQEQP